MKPYIICHMMSSVDGRLYVERYSKPFDGKVIEEFSGQYFTIADELDAQAWLIGRKTVQEIAVPRTFNGADLTQAANPATFIGSRNAKRSIIVVDPRGKVFYESGDINGDDVIAVLGEKASEQYLAHLRAMGISYLFAGPDGNNMAKAMNILGNEFGITKVLVEGGGFVNGTFLKAGLIDELSLMIYPGVDGLSGVPSYFEYRGEPDEHPAEGQALEFLSVKPLPDGIVWLRYRFHKL